MDPVILMLIAGSIALLVGGGLLVLSYMRNLVNQRLDALHKRYPDREVVKLARTANLIGLLAKDERVLRGNGTLLLTPRELVFAMWIPDRQIVIPLKDIRACDEVDSFAGKKIFRPLLHLIYESQAGEASLALYVPEHQDWIKSIESLRATLPENFRTAASSDKPGKLKKQGKGKKKKQKGK